MAEFAIVGNDGEEQHAGNGHVSLTLIPNGTASRVRRRTAIRHIGTPRSHTVQWLFGELNGVRCYVKDDGGAVHIVLTQEDLYP